MSSPNFALVVQTIEVSWTKDSRGGTLATPRNRVPEIAHLPFKQPPPKTAAPTYLRHDIGWGESNEFQQPLTEKLEIAEFSGEVRNHIIGLHTGDDNTSIKVTFEGAYSRKSGLKVLIDYTRLGAPARTVPIEIFTLNLSEWGQIRYNGRFSWGDSGWKYEKWVFNIGLFESAISANCFQGSAARSYSNLADLW